MSSEDQEVFAVRVETEFTASHRRGADGDETRAHEHRWRVAVRARARKLDAIGLVVDFRRLRAAADEVVARLEGELLDELPQFADGPGATPPRVAEWLYGQLRDAVPAPRCRLSAVEVEADPGQRFEYRRSP